MSDHILKTIDHFREEISKAEEALAPKKTLVNQLCAAVGIPLAYPDVVDASTAKSVGVVRRNAFYGRPISTCIREFLESRSSLPVKEATLDEIFEALKAGGFDMKQVSDKEEDQRRGLAITLGKNSQTFHRLPTNDWGLLAWYPAASKAKKGKNGDAQVQARPGDGTTIEATSPENEPDASAQKPPE